MHSLSAPSPHFWVRSHLCVSFSSLTGSLVTFGALWEQGLHILRARFQSQITTLSILVYPRRPLNRKACVAKLEARICFSALCFSLQFWSFDSDTVFVALGALMIDWLGGSWVIQLSRLYPGISLFAYVCVSSLCSGPDIMESNSHLTHKAALQKVLGWILCR